MPISTLSCISEIWNFVGGTRKDVSHEKSLMLSFEYYNLSLPCYHLCDEISENHWTRRSIPANHVWIWKWHHTMTSNENKSSEIYLWPVYSNQLDHTWVRGLAQKSALLQTCEHRNYWLRNYMLNNDLRNWRNLFDNNTLTIQKSSVCFLLCSHQLSNDAYHQQPTSLESIAWASTFSTTNKWWSSHPTRNVVEPY